MENLNCSSKLEEVLNIFSYFRDLNEWLCVSLFANIIAHNTATEIAETKQTKSIFLQSSNNQSSNNQSTCPRCEINMAVMFIDLHMERVKILKAICSVGTHLLVLFGTRYDAYFWNKTFHSVISTFKSHFKGCK